MLIAREIGSSPQVGVNAQRYLKPRPRKGQMKQKNKVT